MKTVEYNGVKLQLVEDKDDYPCFNICYFKNKICLDLHSEHPELDCMQDGTDEHWEEVKKDLTNKNK